MATYFHGGTSEINNSSSSPSPHADGLQTLYLMNPNNYHAPYSDAPHHHTPPTPNMLLLNPNAPPPHALNLAHLSHAPPLPSPNQHQHLANILASANSEDHSRPSLFGPHEITAAFHGFSPAPRVHYNLWGSVVDQTQQSSAAATPSSSSAGGGDVSPQMDFRRPSQQGLSLSLSSQQQRTVHYRSLSGEIVGNSPSSASNGISSVQSVILGSKYLKAAQELLDEVVNVGNNNKKEELGEKVKGNRDSNSGGVGDGSSGGGGGENSDAGGKHVAELTTAQRQELQMKKSKLVSMLDEVEQRYRQYQQQMQIVISSFEQAAGYGGAKSYTALALKTISKQFRCLKDAISSEIRGTSKTLGEEDHNCCLGVKVMEGGSRLRYVDHHLRQQRALQQLGMIQPNAWRPQRGLPERAVSILRAWLFEHFLHPYPKDSDKVMLAKQTGLTRSQVSNWFINARVRLWKPMVEEMYLEETKEQEHKKNSNNMNMRSTSNNPTDESGDVIKLDQIKIPQSNQQEIFFNHQNTTTASPTEISGNSSMSTSPNMGGGGGGGGFHLVGVGSSDKAARRTITTASEIMLNSPSSILSADMEIKHHHNHTNHNNNNKFIGIIDQSHTKDGYPLMTGISPNHGGGGGFGGFSMEDMIGSSRFNNNNVTDHQLASSTRFQGNSVSLTLGLPHNNNENLSISGTPPPHQQHQHGFLSQNIHNLGRRLEIGGSNNNNGNNEFCVINTAPPPSHSASYETTIDIQNTKRFAAQLLPDFVA